MEHKNVYPPGQFVAEHLLTSSVAGVRFMLRLMMADFHVDDPGVVADVVLKAASAAHPKLRYTASSTAGRLRLLRKFAPARVLDAGIRKDLQLDAIGG